MDFYRFTSIDGRARALTADRSGESLPDGAESWAFLGPMTLGPDSAARVGVSADEAAAQIARDGYLILPPPPSLTGDSRAA